MARYIDVDELKHDLDWLESDTPVYLDVMSTIDERTTVDPVKHGHWIGKPIAGYSTVRCSKCGDAFLENTGKWNYCPNCGANMSQSSNSQVKANEGERREDGTLN